MSRCFGLTNLPTLLYRTRRHTSSVIISIFIFLLIFGLSIFRCITSQASSTADPTSPRLAEPAQSLQGEKAIKQLKQDGTYNSLSEAMSAIRYRANWQPTPRLEGLGAAYELQNPANNLLAYVTADGLQVTSLEQTKTPWRIGIRLQSIGRSGASAAVSSGEVTATENRVSIQRSASDEWFLNSARGLEHGLTIKQAPAAKDAAGDLQVIFSVDGDLSGALNGSGAVTFSREVDNVLLVYEKLFVTDAKGRAVTSRMALKGSELIIEVEDAGAEYPLTIDPLLREQTKLTAANGAANDQFGSSVAISGDTLVVGALQDQVGANTFQGSAYVFVRSGTTWALQQQLTASDGAGGDSFGVSVSISGDTVIVGAFLSDVGPNSDQGSAYIFTRSGTTWTQQAKLIAPDGAAVDYFGVSVAISGDSVVVGAVYDDVGANTDQGSAHVFVRSGTTWTHQAKLTASDGAANDQFGFSVSISGDSVVVGAGADNIGANLDQGSAYVFVRSGTTWSQQQQLTASDGAAGDGFGVSVAISGDSVVVGAADDDVGPNTNQGSAYVFVRSGTTWSQQTKLSAADGVGGDQFGISVAISGDTVVVGAYLDDVGANADQGSAYIFVRDGTTWSQQQQLTASDGAAGDQFGFSVSISGDTMVVGAFLDDVGVNTNQGSVYMFICNWNETAHPVAGDGSAGDQFGFSVAISGDTAVVGANGDDIGANTDQGSAYVFVRSGTTWTQQQQLTASDGAASDQFGISVSISGDTVVVGANLDDVGANANQGSAYVFVRSGTTWTQQQKLLAADGAAGDQFGNAVGISGDTVVVGAFADTVGANSGQGSAYIFVRIAGIWIQQQQLTASDGAAGDQFGDSVSISGDTVVVGANLDDVGANANQGSAYVFIRLGTPWTQQQKLTAADGAINDFFGASVRISSDTIVVGANGDDIGGNTDQGSAYVFVRSGTSWNQQQKLFASDGAAIDQFGISVAISGDFVVVGANLDDVGANVNQGSAYVYWRSGTQWYDLQHLTASDGAGSDFYGRSVAISGNTIVVGASLDDVGANADQGSAYIYSLGCNTVPTIAASNVVRQKGSAAAISTIANVFDTEDPIGYLTLTVVSSPTGITVTNVTNTSGVVTASIAAGCNAALGNNVVVLRVQDSDGGVAPATLLVNVTANTLPSLGAYSDFSLAVGGSTTLFPSFVPSDNGSIVEFKATSPTFAGTLGADPDSGAISISNARPGGTHVITVTATDNCGATISTGFLLNVTCQFITVNPITIPSGTSGSPYSQVFTQTGGNGTTTFSLSGSLPSGMFFTPSTATLSGTPTQVGNFPITVTATDQNNCSGSRSYTLTIAASLLAWTGNTSTDWQTPTNWSPNAIPTSFNDVLIPSSGVVNEPTISTSSSVIHAMTLQSGRVLTINSNRQLVAQGDVTTTGQIAGAGLLAFEGGTMTQNGAISLASVQFDAGNHLLTGGGTFASNIISVLNGATVTLTSSHTVSVIVVNSGGIFDATNQNLTLTGAGTPIFNSGSFIATGSTIAYQGSVAQVVTSNIAYNNLTINNGPGASLAADTTVNGQLNLMTDLTTGAFTLTMPSSGSSAGTGDVIGNLRRTGFVNGAPLSFGNPFNTLRFDSGTPPSDVNINLVKSAPSGFPANTVSRTYTITPNGRSGYSATLRLRYKDAELSGLNENTLELWRYNGASWVSPPGTATRDTTANWIEETGITAFSPWAIAGPSGPTLVELISFEATGYDKCVLLDWQTGYESENLGFNIYRESAGKRELVNAQLVAGSALRAGSTLSSGDTYSLLDSRPEENVAYWLEDIDLKGQSTWHGPFYVRQVGGAPPARAQAPLLSAIGRGSTDSIATAISRLAGPSVSASGAILMQSTLASQGAIKISVMREGLYRVTQPELAAAGLSRAIDARRLQLFVEGQEVPITVSTGKDGLFDETSYIEFYGIGMDSPWTSARTYWLSAGKQPGKRIPIVETSRGSASSPWFMQTIERRERSTYFASLLNGDAENFFGAVLTSQPVDQSLTLEHLASPGGQVATLEIALQGVTHLGHRVSAQLNGDSVGYVDFSGQAHTTAKFSLSQSQLQDGINTVRLIAEGGPSDVSLVDYIRLTYARDFKTDDNRLTMTVMGGEEISIDGFSAPAVRVLDVTDASAPHELTTQIAKGADGRFTVTVSTQSGSERRLLALSSEEFDHPASVRADVASALKTASGADLVIVTRRDFFAALEPLRAAREREGLRAMLVDVEDVYDEFSFGQKSPQAIRDFLSFARANWKTPPAYLLLAGDASYDPKNYLGFGDDDEVPTRLVDTAFLETASDDWFSDFNNDGICDISTGRLPIRTSEEATALVNKILRYGSSASPAKALLVSDENDGYDFEGELARLRPLLEPKLTVDEIRRGQTDAATAKTLLLKAFADGRRIINYTGHGSVNVWRGNLLTSEDARALRNDILPVLVSMTCLNGYFHDAAIDGIGESMLKAEQGGAIAVWASTGMTMPDHQARVNEQLYRLMLLTNLRGVRLGDLLRRAKSATSDLDVHQTFVLLGDPTTMMK